MYHALLGGPGAAEPIIVAHDGSGAFTTLAAAVGSLPRQAEAWRTIVIRPGTYREKLRIDGYTRLRLLGDDRDRCLIAFDDCATRIGPDGQPLGTGGSFTMMLRGRDLALANLTIANTSGPRETARQAIALYADADRVTITNCRLASLQDTLYANGGRQYYRDCLIEGDVDYVFGNATAVFDRCELRSLAPGWVTAQSRTSPEQPSGYVFSRCRLTGPAKADSVYLGRPWRPYARVVLLDCELGPHILGAGWHNWGDPANEATAFFAERGNTGPGARPSARVAWSRQLDTAGAEPFEPTAMLSAADGWTPTAPDPDITEPSDPGLRRCTPYLHGRPWRNSTRSSSAAPVQLTRSQRWPGGTASAR